MRVSPSPLSYSKKKTPNPNPTTTKNKQTPNQTNPKYREIWAFTTPKARVPGAAPAAGPRSARGAPEVFLGVFDSLVQVFG